VHPLDPIAPIATILPPSKPVGIIAPSSVSMTLDQRRAAAIFADQDNAAYMLRPAAIKDVPRAQKEIDIALNGIAPPPTIPY
jgi:hypothetical protein